MRSKLLSAIVRGHIAQSSRSFAIMSTEPAMRVRRQFAPLGKPESEVTTAVPFLDGIVFDVDGTLCKLPLC